MPAEILNILASTILSTDEVVVQNERKNERSTKSILLATELKRWKFALALPIINTKLLPNDAKSCPQCQETYNPEFEVAGRRIGHEVAAVLPCNCVIGFHCARQWLSPHESGFTSCPFCKQEFPEMAEERTHPQVLSDSAWMNCSDRTRDLLPIHGTDRRGEQSGQIAPLTTAPDACTDEVWHFPSIGEVLMGDLSTSTLAILKKPEIVVTTPEGETSSNYEISASGKHISNADTAVTFTKESDKMLQW